MPNVGKLLILVAAGVLGGVLEGASAGKSGSAPGNEPALKNALSTLSFKSVSKQEAETKTNLVVREANRLFELGEYQKAIDLYISAKKSLGEFGTDAFQKQIEYCEEQIGKSYYYMALDALKKADEHSQVNDYDEAIKLCKQAIEMYPPCEEVMNKRIKRYEQFRETAVDRGNTSTNTLLPDKATQEFDIQVLLQRGREFAQREEYTQARKAFEDVLLLDPYRAEALQNLKVILRRITEKGERRHREMHRNRMAMTAWEWALPFGSRAKEGEEALDSPQEKAAADEMPIMKKLKSITIPKIDFEEVSIPTAILYLQEQSKQHDPEQIGVNFHLRLRGDTPPAAAAAAGEGGAAEPGAEGAAAPGDAAPADGAAAGAPVAGDVEAIGDELKNKKLSLSIKDLTLAKAIDIIAKSAGLRYKVERYAVVIAPTNVQIDDLITKIYPVDSAAFPDGDDPASLEAFFKDQIPAVPGAKIVLDKGLSRLIVTNTAENQQKIEEIVAGLAKQEPMVQIQIKVVEVSQADLKEMGFNWSLAQSNGNDFGSLNSGTAGNNQLVKVVGQMGDFNLTAEIYAANELSGKDVLFSPRVTTLSGKPVTVRMVRQVYLVEDYDESEYETTTSSSSTTTDFRPRYQEVSVFPNFDSEPTEFGIKFGVQPFVDQTRRTIRMRIDPEFKTLNGWEYYSSTDAEGTEEVVRNAIIGNRKITTEVTIKDGSTVVIGGVIKDEVTRTLIKTPVLGDIPLIGRLFQTRQSNNRLTNLLIFVTAKLIKPDGTPFFPDMVIPTGKADFF
ncbi:MAG: hypothetical protein PHS41_11815 [Victivallaceae bacterium]|nr:hypothetical protein [Victivallaceae bacterium]